MRALLLSAVLLVAPAIAQVCVTGVVRAAPGPSPCMQLATHELECTRIQLLSSAVDLNRFVGQNVRITGRDVGVTCTVLDVSRVDPPSGTLTWCGAGSTGCPLKLKVCPVGIGRWWTFLGLDAGYRPLGCGGASFLDGALLVQEPILPIAAGGPSPCGEVTLPVPFDNALVGVMLWVQAARQDIGPVGPLELLNVQCIRLSPFLPPCAPVNC